MTTTINADNGAVSGSAGLKSSADATGVLALQTNGTTAISISAAQVVSLTSGLAVTGAISATTTGKVGTTLGVGAATPSASGAGITFPASQSASSNANTLDDYEEGTWTPQLSSDGGSVSNYATQIGFYRKIGSQVTLWFTVQANTITGALLVRLENLPFSVATSGTGYQPATRNGMPVISIETYLGSGALAMQYATTGTYLLPVNAQGQALGGTYTFIATA